MILVDSSGWIEYFSDGPLAGAYGKHLEKLSDVVTPTVVLYEVYKTVKRLRGDEAAAEAAGLMGKTAAIPLTEQIALTAADLSLAHKLAMADAIVYATASIEQARLITSGSDLEGLPGVTYLKKP